MRADVVHSDCVLDHILGPIVQALHCVLDEPLCLLLRAVPLPSHPELLVLLVHLGPPFVREHASFVHLLLAPGVSERALGARMHRPETLHTVAKSNRSALGLDGLGGNRRRCSIFAHLREFAGGSALVVAVDAPLQRRHDGTWIGDGDRAERYAGDAKKRWTRSRDNHGHVAENESSLNKRHSVR